MSNPHLPVSSTPFDTRYIAYVSDRPSNQGNEFRNSVTGKIEPGEGRQQRLEPSNF